MRQLRWVKTVHSQPANSDPITTKLTKMDETIELRKVRLVKDSTLTISYLKEETDKTKTFVKDEIHKSPVHADLKSALKALRIHFGLLSDYVKTTQVKKIGDYDSKLVEDFFIHGYSVGGGEDEKGVVITGQKKTASGKMVTINTPFIRFEEQDETAYKHIDDLLNRIQVIESEVGLYLEGKQAPEPQQSLFAPEPKEYLGDEDEIDLPPSDNTIEAKRQTIDA